jgi:hypothetical protein
MGRYSSRALRRHEPRYFVQKRSLKEVEIQGLARPVSITSRFARNPCKQFDSQPQRPRPCDSVRLTGPLHLAPISAVLAHARYPREPRTLGPASLLCLESISMGGQFRAVAAEHHAAPSACVIPPRVTRLQRLLLGLCPTADKVCLSCSVSIGGRCSPPAAVWADSSSTRPRNCSVP